MNSHESNVAHGDRTANPDPDWWAWHHDGWEMAPEGSVRDARTCTRGKAAAAFARELGEDITRVRVWKRYAVALTYQDVWDDYGDDWWHDHWESPDDEPDADLPPTPDLPPAEWEPDFEYHPCWRIVDRSHPRAIPIWICGEHDAPPPHRPRAPERVA